MKPWLTPTSNDDTSNDRDKSTIGNPSLSLKSHEIREERGEKRRRSTDGLIERDGEVTERDVTADDGGAEDDAESGDLEELGARFEVLERDELEEDDGDVAEEGAGGHVAHGEEDGELEAVVGEEELVEEEDADVGGVP